MVYLWSFLVAFGQRSRPFGQKSRLLLAKSDQNKGHFWPKEPASFGQKLLKKQGTLGQKSRLLLAKSTYFFWPKEPASFGRKPASLAKDGPTGLITGNTREYTGIQGIHAEYTGIHGNTGNTGTPGIPGTREYREYREYREPGYIQKPAFGQKKPAFGQKGRSFGPAGPKDAEPGSVG